MPGHGARLTLGRRLAVVLTALAGVAATTCSAEGPDPSAIVVTGRVTDTDGAGIADVVVEARPVDELQGASARLNALGDLGLACVDERPPPECTDGASGTHTDDDGSFGVAVSGTGAPPSVVAGPVTVEIAARASTDTGELTGPSVATAVALSENENVGDLALWQPSLELSSAEAGDGVFSWSPHPAGDVDYRALAETSDGRLLWDEATAELELTFPAEALRDTAGGISVVARARNANLVWRSARIPYVADADGVRLTGVDAVDWPSDRGISEIVVLVAIIGLLLSSAMLVLVSGSRHRRRLRLMQALPLPRGGGG